MGDDTTMSGNQQFIADLFATGVSGYVDSQYARNYSPNDPRNYNAGRPAGVSTAAVLSQSPVMIVGVVAVLGLLVFLAVK
jgi:hypothetical protein